MWEMVLSYLYILIVNDWLSFESSDALLDNFEFLKPSYLNIYNDIKVQ